MYDWIKHAFAVDSHPGPPKADQMRMVDSLAREIVRRRLTTPAMVFLESSRPMNFLGAQALHFFAPIVTSLFDATGYETFATFLERRDSIEILATRIEDLERIASERESNCSTGDAGSAPPSECEN